jgi:hypothetical protein
LTNLYSSLSIDKLISKSLFLTKYQEIPLKLFIEHLITQKQPIDIKKLNKIYCKGVNIYSKDNYIEIYYINKCKIFEDNNNFISLEKTLGDLYP